LDSYLRLTPDEQRTYCEQAGADLGLPPASIEKDFWVCWVLKELFSLPGIGNDLTFKGGTSLSKGWGLIQRFSEDIDIVIKRSRLGVGERPEKESSKAWKQYLETLSAKTRDFIATTLTPTLKERLSQRLPEGMEWELTHIQDDAANEVILFRYPPVLPEHGYLSPAVKVEPGARSDTAPTERRSINAFLTDLLKGEPFEVLCVHPKRTFLEKAMLLHEELCRNDGRPPKARLARHYYDLARLIDAGVGDQALSDPALFDAVAEHRAVFFRKSEAARKSMQRGTICLVPSDAQRAHWERDYDAMREVMFYGPPPPSFKDILQTVAEFERKLNDVKD
jgi:hypothetical protein